MERKVSIKNYVNIARNCLRKQETENSKIPEHLGNEEIYGTFTCPSIGIEFVWIPAGKFEKFSPVKEENKTFFERPVHKIVIENSFYLGRYAITQQQWKKLMGQNPSHFKGDNHPVEMISWRDVLKFIKKLNEEEGTDKYRLPSEAEWEYACGAGTQTKYYFGDYDSKLSEYAWYAENSGGKTHPVCHKKQNPWGLYDMHGNVWEWVQDNWHENYNIFPLNGTALEDIEDFHRVSRGGSWYCDAGLCCSTSRFKRDPENQISNLGFRVLKEI